MIEEYKGPKGTEMSALAMRMCLAALGRGQKVIWVDAEMDSGAIWKRIKQTAQVPSSLPRASARR